MAKIQWYVSDKSKSTSYGTVRREGGFDWWADGSEQNEMPSWRAVVQRIYVHADDEERLRFGYYNADGYFIPRPMEIPDELLPKLMAGAAAAEVVSSDQLPQLIGSLLEGATAAGALNEAVLRQLREQIDAITIRREDDAQATSA